MTWAPLDRNFLVGLPELSDRLALRRNRSLHSRLHHRIAVDGLIPDDTAEYLRTRLRRAGCERELFATDAVCASCPRRSVLETLVRMSSPSSSPGHRSHVAFDWIDILLVFSTLCGAFALAAALGTSDSSDLFQYGTAAAILAVVVVRRAVSPPRVAAVSTRRSAFGIIGAVCMIVGLLIASFGGSMFLDEWKRPVKAIRVDREAIDREIGLPGLAPTCIRDGKQVRGRQCRTPEEIAKEAAADQQMYAEQIAELEAEKRRRMSSTASLAGIGVALTLVGIVLDILRTRRDKASETSLVG